MTRIQGMTITCPEGWRDASMLVLTAPEPGPTGVAPSFVVTREAMPADPASDDADRLTAFVDRQVEQMRHSLPDVSGITRRQAPHPGALPELRVDWVSDGVPITQWITYAEAAADTVMIATGTTGRADFDAVEPVFRTMLASFRID